MRSAIVQLTYRQIIDAKAESDFEKKVLHFSYDEYKLKSQAYNADGTINTFTALKAKDGRANSLHYKTGFAIGGLVDSLQNVIPCVKDTLGQQIEFDVYKFEVIESDINNKSKHCVAIHYTTAPLLLIQIIGDTLLLSKESNPISKAQKPVETFMLKTGEGFSIVSYQEVLTFSKEEH